MAEAKPLPTGTPTEFEVKLVERKKSLPDTGHGPKAVLKLGLRAGEQAGYAEMFCPADEGIWPKVGEKLTLIITEPANPNWLPKANKPRAGGGGFRGTPKDSNSIEAQCAFKGAIDLIVAGKAETTDIAVMTQKCVDAIRGAK